MMLASATRSRFCALSRRTFATEVSAATSVTPDKKYKVVVVGAGPGGLSGVCVLFVIRVSSPAIPTY